MSHRRRVPPPILPITAALVALVVALGGGLAIEHYLGGDRPAALTQAPRPSGSTTAPAPGDSADPSPSRTRAHRPRRTATRHPATPSMTRPTAASSSPAASGALAAAAQVVKLTNAQRAAHGCEPLRVDARLARAARQHSADMDRRRYFDHDTPDGENPWDRIKSAGYSMPGAENIAMGQQTAAAVMDAWMHSPGHRANILNCGLKAIGVGVQYDTGGPWWTQDFGWI